MYIKIATFRNILSFGVKDIFFVSILKSNFQPNFDSIVNTTEKDKDGLIKNILGSMLSKIIFDMTSEFFCTDMMNIITLLF